MSLASVPALGVRASTSVSSSSSSSSSSAAASAAHRRTFEIRVAKPDSLRFAAAHFTAHGDGTRERLHGHNYGLELRVAAAMSRSAWLPWRSPPLSFLSAYWTTTGRPAKC